MRDLNFFRLYGGLESLRVEVMSIIKKRSYIFYLSRPIRILGNCVRLKDTKKKEKVCKG